MAYASGISLTGQVVVANDHIDAQCIGLGHTFRSPDAAIKGDDDGAT